MAKSATPYVEVHWKDAWANSTDEVHLDDAFQRNTSYEYRTRGWLLNDDPEDGVLLAPEENLTEPGTFRGPMHIPRLMVVSMTELVVRTKGVRKKKPFIKNEQSQKLNDRSHDGGEGPVMPDPAKDVV